MKQQLQKSSAVIMGLLFLGSLLGCDQSKIEEMMGYLEVENASRREAACMRLGMMGSRVTLEGAIV